VDARKYPVLYFLSDIMGKPLTGSFEKEELVQAEAPAKDHTFTIRKIGKNVKLIGGKKCVFVDFLFYPRSFSEWSVSSVLSFHLKQITCTTFSGSQSVKSSITIKKAKKVSLRI
jgi:hypothetical protein